MKIKTRKARIEHTCHFCSEPILPGQHYYIWFPRLGFKNGKKRHQRHGYPRPSILTTSDKLATIYGVQEAIEDFIPTLDELLLESDYGTDVLDSQVNEWAQEIRGVQDEYQESFDNLTEATSSDHPLAYEIEEKIQACEEFAEALEQIEGNWPDLEFDPDDWENENPRPDPADYTDEQGAEFEDAELDWEQRRDEAKDEAVQTFIEQIEEKLQEAEYNG